MTWALTPQEIYSAWYRTNYPISHYNMETVYTPYWVVDYVDEFGVEWGHTEYLTDYVQVPVYYNDSDGDGLADVEETGYATSSSTVDSDGDGLKDGFEVFYTGTPPDHALSSSSIWTDGELFFGYGAPSYDFDGDGISNNLEEWNYFTNPREADTDGDGVNDYDELFVFFTDPTRPPNP